MLLPPRKAECAAAEQWVTESGSVTPVLLQGRHPSIVYGEVAWAQWDSRVFLLCAKSNGVGLVCAQVVVAQSPDVGHALPAYFQKILYARDDDRCTTPSIMVAQ